MESWSNSVFMSVSIGFLSEHRPTHPIPTAVTAFLIPSLSFLLSRDGDRWRKL